MDLIQVSYVYLLKTSSEQRASLCLSLGEKNTGDCSIKNKFQVLFCLSRALDVFNRFNFLGQFPSLCVC